MLKRLDLSVFCPADLAICQGVFDQICAQRAFARATKEAELTANAVLVLFQDGVIEESDLLLEAMRFIDKNGGWRKASPSPSRDQLSRAPAPVFHGPLPPDSGLPLSKSAASASRALTSLSYEEAWTGYRTRCWR